MTQASGLTAAQTWEKGSQAAVSAIRGRGDTKQILVPGYNWSGAQRWSSTHPTKWIVDSANNFRYEAHHYWDRDNSGQYKNTYAAEVLDAVNRGYGTTSESTTTTTAAPTTTTTQPSAPAVRVTDVTVKEGRAAKFTVSLSAGSTRTVTVSYSTADGSARQPGDYTPASGTISFAPGSTSKTVSVSTLADGIKEPAETFALNLASPVNATIADGSAIATISAR
jgi:hypothetical protein